MRELDDAGTRAVVAIQRLQAAYADAVTRRDWARSAGCSSPTPSSTSTPARASPFTLDGPGRARRVHRAAPSRRFTFFEFTILNATVEVDGDDATGRMYICELRADGDGTWSEAYGLYRDRYRRRDGALADRRSSVHLARPARARTAPRRSPAPGLSPEA